MVDFGLRDEPMFFEDPIDLLFFAPHYIPVISVNLFPLPIRHSFVDAVSKRCFVFDGGAK